MIATNKFVKERFDKFNILIFKGALPDIPPRIKTRWKSEQKQRELEDRIIHDMIHLYITHMKITDTGKHGLVFRRITERINREYSRNVFPI